MPAAEIWSTIIGSIGGILYWIFVVCFFKYFGRSSEMRQIQGLSFKTQTTKICLLHHKQSMHKPRADIKFSRKPREKQADQSISTFKGKDGSNLASYLNPLEPNISAEDDEEFSLWPSFLDAPSKIQIIENSVELSLTARKSNSVVSIRLGDQEKDEMSTSEEIVVIRHHIQVANVEDIMVLG